MRADWSGRVVSLGLMEGDLGMVYYYRAYWRGSGSATGLMSRPGSFQMLG